MDQHSQLDDAFRRAMLEAIPCAVAVLDREDRVIFWNRTAEQVTGYSSGEMLGADCEILHARLSHPPDEQTLTSLCPLGDKGRDWDEQCRIRRKDGREVPVVRKARPVRDARGRPLGTIQTFMDVSFIHEVQSRLVELRERMASLGRLGELVGSTPAMREIYQLIRTVAPTDATVLIEGETGTGKELIARELHNHSRRADRVFLAVNCGALPEELLQAELFGHVRGAFTGATADRPGHFEQADGGTLFLDEVGELPPAAQVRLLRAVQEKEIVRLGESQPRPVDVRILAATNKQLAEEVRAGRFREDLYYRLRVVGLEVPPLRERREDIPQLAAAFVEALNAKYDRRVRRIAPEAMRALERCDWPGNVRQLRHAIEHAFVVSAPRAETLAADSLPPEVLTGTNVRGTTFSTAPESSPPADDEQSHQAHPISDDPRQAVLDALQQAGGNKSRAARILGLTRAGLYNRLKRFGIEY
jgi:PAS domain S-box-containing protein